MQRYANPLMAAAASFALMLTVAGCGPNLIQRIGLRNGSLSCCGIVVVILDIIALLEIAGSNRSAGDKVLWAAIIIFFPILGCIAYYFFGRK